MATTRGRHAAAANLRPVEFVAGLVEQPRQSFLSSFGDTKLLLIRLDEPDGELASGLSETDFSGGTKLRPAQDSIGYATVVASRAALRRAAPAPASGASTAADPPALRARIARAVQFAVALRKRPGAGKHFTDRISVGRARNNDIVLRHASVSKFHAWFECDEETGFYLGDARSKNLTLLNGAPMDSTKVVPLKPGDEIHFGSVEALLCSADCLWDALMPA